MSGFFDLKTLKALSSMALCRVKKAGSGLFASFNEQERRLTLQAVVIGAIVWTVVFTLKGAVHWSFDATLRWIENASTPLALFAPLLLGAPIAVVFNQYLHGTVHYRDEKGRIHELNDVEGDGLERAIALYYASEPVLEQSLRAKDGVEARWELPTISLAIRKFLATLATLGTGGSGGLEASVVLIGESLAAGLFKPRRLIDSGGEKKLSDRFMDWWRQSNPDELQTMQLCGISAAVAVLLGAPFASAFFAVEVMYRRRIVVDKLLFALISALVAYSLTHFFSAGNPAIFPMESLSLPPWGWKYVFALTAMTAVISLVSIGFGKFRSKAEHYFKDYHPNIWRRQLLGAAITGAVALVVLCLTRAFGLTPHGLELVLGLGESAIDLAFAGKITMAAALLALPAKMAATASTIGSGGSAGLLVPSLFFGTMIATVFEQFFGFPSGALIAPAMAASLTSMVNVPLAAALFVVEIFGGAYMMPALAALVVSYVLAHDNTVYRPQRDDYEKRDILPGVSLRRIRAPMHWEGKTLAELDFRARFGVNVVGVVDRPTPGRKQTAYVDGVSERLLSGEDLLVVLGNDEKLDVLERAISGALVADDCGSLQ